MTSPIATESTEVTGNTGTFGICMVGIPPTAESTEGPEATGITGYLKTYIMYKGLEITVAQHLFMSLTEGNVNAQENTKGVLGTEITGMVIILLVLIDFLDIGDLPQEIAMIIALQNELQVEDLVTVDLPPTVGGVIVLEVCLGNVALPMSLLSLCHRVLSHRVLHYLQTLQT